MNIHAALAKTAGKTNSQPRFLMCPPRYFAVSYSINPWMNPAAWSDGASALHAQAELQWAGLRRVLVGLRAGPAGPRFHGERGCRARRQGGAGAFPPRRAAERRAGL